MDTELVIKVTYEANLRRFSVLLRNGSLDLDIAGLRAKICDLFKFKPDADFTLTYYDEDGDVVTLVDDADLSDAIKQRLDPLRMIVFMKNDSDADFYGSGSSTPMRSSRTGSYIRSPFSMRPSPYPILNPSLFSPMGPSSYTPKPSVPISSTPVAPVTAPNSAPKPSPSSETGSEPEHLLSTLVHNLAAKVASAAPEQYRDFVSKLSFDVVSKAAAASPAPLIELVETLSKLAMSHQDPFSEDQVRGVSEKPSAEKSEDSKTSKNVDTSDQMEASQLVSNDKNGSTYNDGNLTSSVSTSDPQVAAKANVCNESKNTGLTSGSGFSSLLCSMNEKTPTQGYGSYGPPGNAAGKMPQAESGSISEHPFTGAGEIPPFKASDSYYSFSGPTMPPAYIAPYIPAQNPWYGPEPSRAPLPPGCSPTTPAVLINRGCYSPSRPAGTPLPPGCSPTYPAVQINSGGYSSSRPAFAHLPPVWPFVSETRTAGQPVAPPNKGSVNGEIPPVVPKDTNSESGELGSSASKCAPSGGVHLMPTRRSFGTGHNMGRVFHQGVRCDGCGVHPITGTRYKSRVKEDYDLCSICFTDLGNEADYTRLDRPMCYRSPRLPKVHDMGKTSMGSHGVRTCGLKSSNPLTFDSRFVEDVNIVDGTLMPHSTEFTKIWRMVNSGVAEWPLGTRIVWIGGDKLTDVESFELELPVEGCPVGRDLKVAIDFTTPSEPGQYVSYWRMSLPSGQKFGQCVWVLIQVESPQRNSQSEGCKSLNLNLPPDSGDVKDQIIDVNVEPMGVVNPKLYPDVATESVKPMVGGVKEMEDTSSDSINSNANYTVPVGLAESYPVVESPIGSSGAVAVADAPSFFGEGGDDNTLEQSLLMELEQMGFKEVNLNKRILRANDYDFAQSLDELCCVAEWDPMLEELQEMGFHDKETNRRLLIKNGGSLKRVVMDLIAAENA